MAAGLLTAVRKDASHSWPSMLAWKPYAGKEQKFGNRPVNWCLKVSVACPACTCHHCFGGLICCISRMYYCLVALRILSCLCDSNVFSQARVK